MSHAASPGSPGSRSAFRVVNWNVNWRANRQQRRDQLALVRELDPDLLLLQEVRESTLRPFREEFAWTVFALGPNPDDPRWTARVGTAVLGSERFRLRSQMLIAPTWFGLSDDLRWKANRFARRATWASLEMDPDGPRLLAGSLHASPAAGDIAQHKPWYHAGVARWLSRTGRAWLFGIDANTPAHDPIDEDGIRWCWPRTTDHPGEDELLGSNVQHRGRDLYRAWLHEHPAELERIHHERPDGPLAVSHRLRTGPVRYDHCWATHEVAVDHIEYIEEAFRYSDHAAIVADLRLGVAITGTSLAGKAMASSREGQA